MSAILAIDPGTVQSAWLMLDDGTPSQFAIAANEGLLGDLREGFFGAPDVIVIEKVESFGMAVGRDVFETVHWAGRFAEAAHPLPVGRIGRRVIKLHLCGSARARDANIRQALIDRYGGSKQAAIGLKASPGPLYGVSKDVWSALAVACTWADQEEVT